MIGAVVVVLCAAFGVAIVRQHGAFQDYRGVTVREGHMPWDARELDPEACVRFAVDWAMACPGLGTWCENEAPRLVSTCMAAHDRSAYCVAQGDAVGSTEFGYAACTAMREDVEGRHAQRSHKKFCAAGYRAIAAHCQTPAPTPQRR